MRRCLWVCWLAAGPVLVALSACLAPALAEEAQPPVLTAGPFAVELLPGRSQIYADACVAKDPKLKHDFDQAVRDLRTRVDEVAKALLASDQFKSLNDAQTPQVLVDDVLKASQALKDKLKDVDPVKSCPVILANFGNIKGEALQAALTEALAAAQLTLAVMKRDKK